MHEQTTHPILSTFCLQTTTESQHVFTANAEHFLYTKSPVFGSIFRARQTLFHSKFVIRCFGFGIEKRMSKFLLSFKIQTFTILSAVLETLFLPGVLKMVTLIYHQQLQQIQTLAEKRYFW